MTLGLLTSIVRPIGGAQDLLIGTMSLIEDGNFFFDEFSRGNAQNIGNSWTEHIVGFNIADFLLETKNNQAGAASHTHSLSTHDDNLIVQGTFQMREGPSNDVGGLRARVTGALENKWVMLQWNNLFNQYQMSFKTSGAPGNIKTFSQSMDDGDLTTLRLVVEDSGSFTYGRAYHFFNPASMSALDNDLIFLFEHSATLGDIPATTESYFKQSAKDPNKLDNTIVAGRNVLITGLSGGHQARILGPAATQSFVTQIDGTASIDIDTYALPMTTLEIADGAGSTLALVTPAKGLWGGDEYSASVII